MGRGAVARALLVAAFAAAWPAAATSQAPQQITCGSRNLQHNFCRVGGITIRHVEIARRISRSACDYGRSWGFQRNGVWVNHGCEAVFALNPRASGPGWGGGWDGGWNASPWSPPGWAIGRWQSRDRWQGRPVLLTIYPEGPVRWVAAGWSSRGMRGHWRAGDTILLDDGTRIAVDRTSFDARTIRLEWRGGQWMNFRRIG